jgi:uncharacterized membrane protein (UPF0127 family)
MPLALVSDDAAIPLASRVEIAVSRRARRRGLLGRQRLDANAALVLVPCAAIHTAFMRFPIDVIFVNHEGRAVRIVSRLRPWRIAVCTAARGVIELAAGAVEKHDVRVGDIVRLVTVGGTGPGVDASELETVRECLELRAS